MSPDEREDVDRTMRAMLAVHVAMHATAGEMPRMTPATRDKLRSTMHWLAGEVQAMTPAERARVRSASAEMLALAASDADVDPADSLAASSRPLERRPRLLPGLIRRARRS